MAPSDASASAKQLRSKLSSGHDNISTKLMKYTLDYIIDQWIVFRPAVGSNIVQITHATFFVNV